MMAHKKQIHRSTVRNCNLFIDDKCKWNNKSCWFLHEYAFDDQKDYDSSEVDKDEVTEPTNQSVFQEVHENLDPPIMKVQKN